MAVSLTSALVLGGSLAAGALAATARAEAATDSAPARVVEIGRSVKRRPIMAYEVGAGPIWLALIGGLHQGSEANSSTLVQTLLAWFAAHPDELPEAVGLTFIPEANPDGAVAGTRQNAAGVDLNRNWDAGWRRSTFGPAGPALDGGGPRPFSEPETRALRDYVTARGLSAAIFFHSQGSVVVPARPQGPVGAFAQAVAQASRYLYLPEWTAYPVSGQAIDYLARLGIYAVDVELADHRGLDFERNRRGVQAATAWLSQSLDRRLYGPAPADFSDVAAGE